MALFRPPMNPSWDCPPTLGHCWHCLRITLFARFTLKASPALRSRLLHFLLGWGHLPVFWPGISSVNSVFSWDSDVLLSDDSISEINFWYINVDSLNVEFIRGYNRYRLSSAPLDWFVCLFVFSSELVPLRKKKNRVLLVENLTPFVSPCMEAFAGRLSNARVIWYSDNQNVESALLNGSRKLDLQVLTFKHYRFSLSITFLLMLGGYLGVLMS